MIVNKRFFPEILQDNEINYFLMIEGIISSVDELASLEITKSPEDYKFRLAPSQPKYINMLLQEILKFHNMFGIHLELGKSIKTSSTISFGITTNN